MRLADSDRPGMVSLQPVERFSGNGALISRMWSPPKRRFSARRTNVKSDWPGTWTKKREAKAQA
jgi:hypothetical protein